ncbi:uncharacterized protein LOC116178237 [Photinus pyralis]|nr:uncharacterized protein LOC116178237 [Photinus pyralis]
MKGSRSILYLLIYLLVTNAASLTFVIVSYYEIWYIVASSISALSSIFVFYVELILKPQVLDAIIKKKLTALMVLGGSGGFCCFFYLFYTVINFQDDILDFALDTMGALLPLLVSICLIIVAHNLYKRREVAISKNGKKNSISSGPYIIEMQP